MRTLEDLHGRLSAGRGWQEQLPQGRTVPKSTSKCRNIYTRGFCFSSTRSVDCARPFREVVTLRLCSAAATATAPASVRSSA
jgi:hypothetical protein